MNNRFYHRIFFFVCLAFLSLTTFSQDLNPLRLELNAKLNENTYTIVPCEKTGVIVFYQGDVQSGKETRWHFALFDNQFAESWVKDTLIQERAEYKSSYQVGDDIFLLFYRSEKIKEDETNIRIIRISLTQGTFKQYNFRSVDKAEIYGFQIIHNTAIIGIDKRRYQSAVIFVDLDSGRLREKEINIEGQTILDGFYIGPEKKKLYVGVRRYNSKEQDGIFLVSYDLRTLEETIIEIESVIENKFLNVARIAVSGNEIFILGTYCNYKNKIPTDDEGSYPESSGYYISKFLYGRQKYINYFNFLEFPTIYNSFSGKELVQIRKRAEKQKKKGQAYSLDYNLIVHPVIDKGGELILLAESFYPEFRTITNMYYDYYGRMVPQTYTVFDGYKYINGIIASFDTEGELLWTNDIGIRDLMTFNLKPYLNFFTSVKEVALFYNRNGKIQYKIIKGNKNVSGLETMKLKLKYSQDRVVDDLPGQMVYWYDNYFLCYGYQEIRNNSRANNRRSVFYLNKIAFQ